MAKNPNEHLFQPANQLYHTTNSELTDGSDYVVTPENLYVYSLGIRDIQAKSVQYHDTQAFVSRPFEVPGNIMEVQLDTDETHPLFDELSGRALTQQTSVEYYLSYKEKPNTLDWVAILPLDQKVVTGERLLPSSTGECELRFPARMATIVPYANGLIMAAGDYTLLSGNRLQLHRYNSNTIYTVNYHPDNFRYDPWTFKLANYKKDVVRRVETFEQGTAYNKTITLDYSPFIDLERMNQETDYDPNTSNYKPIEVFLKNADIQGENNTLVKEVQPYTESQPDLPYTYNRTFYLDKSWSPLKNYNLDPSHKYLGFDYYQFKNKVTFTEHFNVQQLAENLPYTHGNAEIEVHYDTLLTDFRLKIILRRNTSAQQTATPQVDQFQLKFKTIV